MRGCRGRACSFYLRMVWTRRSLGAQIRVKGLSFVRRSMSMLFGVDYYFPSIVGTSKLPARRASNGHVICDSSSRAQ